MKNPLFQKVGVAAVLFILCFVPIIRISAQSNVVVHVDCASTGNPEKGATVFIFPDVTPPAFCKCNGRKCVNADVKQATTNAQGNANITGLAASTNYIAAVGARCITIRKCANPPQDCQFQSSGQVAFTTNKNGGSETTQNISDGLCRVGIIESQVEDLEIFPNPASNQITVDIAGYKGRAQLRIYNTVGQIVLSNSFELTGEESPELNISTLIPGMYKIILFNDEKISVGQFIKE